MKSKAIFTSIFLILTIALQAESDFPQGNTLEFKKETNDFSKLTNMDWEKVRIFFKEADDDQKIKLTFSYKSSSEESDKSPAVGNLNLSLESKKSDLENTISTLQKTFKKLSEL